MPNNPPELRPVHSSNAQAVGYDEAAQDFYVQWKNGKTSVYSSVPANLASDVERSPSVGKAIHSQLKGKFDHRYLEG